MNTSRNPPSAGSTPENPENRRNRDKPLRDAASSAVGGAAGAAAYAAGSDLFSQDTPASAPEPLSGTASSVSQFSTSHPASEPPGVASAAAQELQDAAAQAYPEPTPAPDPAPLTATPEATPEFGMPPELHPVQEPIPTSQASSSPENAQNQLSEAQASEQQEIPEFGGNKISADINKDGKADQIFWDINQDSKVDVVAIDINQDAQFSKEEITVINSPETLVTPETPAAPGTMELDEDKNNVPELLIVDNNADQQADVMILDANQNEVLDQGELFVLNPDALPKQEVEYSGEVAADIPPDVDPLEEEKFKEDLTKLEDPFSDKSDWVA